MVFNFEGVSNIIRKAFKNDGIKGLNSSYVVVINSALENDCSIEELKSLKVVYDELHHEWEKSINIEK